MKYCVICIHRCYCLLTLAYVFGLSDPTQAKAFTFSTTIRKRKVPALSGRLLTIYKTAYHCGSNNIVNNLLKQQPNDKQHNEQEKRLIFLIDDEESMRISVGNFLRSRAYDVVTFDNGESALQRLDRIARNSSTSNQDGNDVSIFPDLVISDVRMPGGMDGLEVLQSLRSSVSFMNIPVILLTAKGMTKDRIEGYNSGADAYIPKPFDPEELITIIENLIRQRDIQYAVATKATSNVNVNDLRRDLDEIKLLLEQGGGGTGNGWIERGSNVHLTPSEKRILHLLCEGYMNKEMAKRVSVSTRRIEQIMTGLFRKTNTKNRTELVRWYISTGQAKL